ncbi:heme exporter protein CcmD [Amphritea atlantica]|jgi:heme exporter protein D|uniref:heme exporter protein CcmD n=1 Tax=Amphritea atlantica TaxID=355243 RepID=UPI003F52D5D5
MSLSFESFAEFIDMGGHGLYVWLSYAIALAVIVINIVNPLMQKRQIFSEQARRLRREKQNS